MAPLCRDFLPEGLQGLLATHDIGSTILVQATDTEAETEFLLDLAGDEDSVAGVVGWVDLQRPEAAETLLRWSQHPKFKGVRPMLQDLPVDWIERAPCAPVVQALQRLGLRFDALVRPEHLGPLRRFLQRHPELPVVIDHAGKPKLARGWQDPWVDTWREHMAALSAHRGVVCKFSGLLTEAGPRALGSVARGLEAVRPVWDQLLRWFGPGRLAWGSDWPVLTLASDHAGWIDICEVLIGELTPGEQTEVWGGTARAFYGLGAVA